MSLPETYKTIGSTNTIFGTGNIASGSLSNQLIESLNFQKTAEKLEIRGNSGAILDCFYFNQTANGSFSLFEKSTGGFTGSVGDRLTVNLDMGSGSTSNIVFDTVDIRYVNNAVVMKDYAFTFYPNAL